MVVLLVGVGTACSDCRTSDAGHLSACEAQRRMNRLHDLKEQRLEAVAHHLQALTFGLSRAVTRRFQSASHSHGRDSAQHPRLGYAADHKPTWHRQANHTHTTLFLHISKSGGTTVSTHNASARFL
jgi:hypothetical protein